MNLFKKSFIGIFILFFVLGLMYSPVDKVKAGVPITVQVKINGSTANQYVSVGQTVKLSWNSTGDSGRTCTNNFGAPNTQYLADNPGFSYTVTAGRTFTVTCSNAACVPGRAVFTTPGSGSWTAPTDIENCKVVITGLAGGAGGKGGDGSNPDYRSSSQGKAGGHGGGAGGTFARIYNDPNYPSVIYRMYTGDVVAFSVGAGGTGGSGGPSGSPLGSEGINGGQTWVIKNGNLVGRAYGGYANSNGGATQSLTTDIDNYWDFMGDAGWVGDMGGTGLAGGDANSGSGWNTLTSYIGKGGAGGPASGFKDHGDAGGVGGNYGAGGGGGGAAGDSSKPCVSSCNHDGGDGGDGAGGFVIIDWFGVGV